MPLSATNSSANQTYVFKPNKKVTTAAPIDVHIGVASGKYGFTTLRKSKYKKSNFSVL